jgi:hypothetical protein
MEAAPMFRGSCPLIWALINRVCMSDQRAPHCIERLQPWQ